MKAPEPSPAILGQRLQQARKAAGLTQQQAADHLSLARTTIVAMEKGDRQLRPEELIAIAGLYRQSVSDLLRPQAPLRSVALQLRGDISPEVRAQIESQSLQLAQDYLFIENLRQARMPSLLPPEVVVGADPVRSARLAAEDERRRLGLGDAPVRSVRDLLEERLGVRTFLLRSVEDSRVSGLYFFEEDAGPVVCINAVHHRNRRRWSAAHELGHALASRHKTEVLTEEDERSRSSRKSPDEIFADAFARFFLIPPSAMERLVGARKRERQGKLLVSDLDEFAADFGVSMDAMCRALEEDGLIRAGVSEFVRSQGYKSVASASVTQFFESDGANTVMSHRFERIAVAAFLEEQISEGTLARLLRVDRLEARERVHELLSASGDPTLDPDTLALKDIS